MENFKNFTFDFKLEQKLREFNNDKISFAMFSKIEEFQVKNFSINEVQ